MAITFYDPNAQQHASANMWQNLLGNMILQKISQNFRAKELEASRELHEQEQMRTLQAQGWSETPELPEGGPTKENAEAIKQQSISIGGKTLYQPKAPVTKQLPGGLTAVWSGGKWEVRSEAKTSKPTFINTGRGVMRWDEDTGRLVPTGETPYQAPRQASPYEGTSNLTVHEVDEEENPIPGTETVMPIRKGDVVKLEGNIRHGPLPVKKERETGELTESGALQQINNMASGDPKTVAELTDIFYANMKTPEGKRRKPSEALIATTQKHQEMQLQASVDVAHKKYPTPDAVKEAVKSGKLDKQIGAYTILRYHADALGQR